MQHNFLVDSSRADNLQQIIEARKHNFMVQSERRAAAAKERALGQRVSKDNDHQVFSLPKITAFFPKILSKFPPKRCQTFPIN
ncbi:hypothetical protein DPMN_142857 [Dreissena polymorpha]|uniref:Uncharacterized protein n=1 Tax=Dreissena polymorpha TaxID=45954 RepID=A0A9D4GF57_DREPO|nr:hypothetical protein DPMN_142857 [Dreissena polymorpha]